MPPKSPGQVVSTADNTSTYFSFLPMYGYKLDRVWKEWAIDYPVKCLEKLGRTAKKVS